MAEYELAQINVAQLRAPMDHPLLADFKNSLDEINALAEEEPGFVWRLTGEGNDATDIRPKPDDPLFAINMSVWRDVDALRHFVYGTKHVDFMRRRREWAHSMKIYMALWWVPTGHRPGIEEGMDALARLEECGPGPLAFSFAKLFPWPALQSGQ